MAKIDYLLQGISEHSHLELMEEILSLQDIQKVVFSVAFMKRRGLLLLEEKLKPFFGVTSVYVGIRNGVTSVQAILELIKNGIHPYIVDTGSNSFIFHPKIFLAYSSKEAKVIIGSANATSGGFTDNIEASTLLHLDRNNSEDEELLNKILNSLNSLVTEFPNNVTEVCSAKEAVRIFQEGRLFDERVSPTPSSTLKSTAKNPEAVPRMRLKVRKRSISSVLKKPKRKKTKIATPISKTQEWVLLWESSPLEESHLSVPGGSNTHHKGALSLVNGSWKDIDKRHYFREEVFDELTWTLGANPRSPEKEWAKAKFEIIIKGISYGIYTLELSHDPRTHTRSYLQNNYMTDIKWGDALKVVARRDLLGLTLRLYKPSNGDTYFIMEIE